MPEMDSHFGAADWDPISACPMNLRFLPDAAAACGNVQQRYGSDVVCAFCREAKQYVDSSRNTEDDLRVIEAWKQWWEEIGHVARCNRDPARTREAFEAGYLAALEQVMNEDTVRMGRHSRRPDDTRNQHLLR